MGTGLGDLESSPAFPSCWLLGRALSIDKAGGLSLGQRGQVPAGQGQDCTATREGQSFLSQLKASGRIQRARQPHSPCPTTGGSCLPLRGNCGLLTGDFWGDGHFQQRYGRDSRAFGDTPRAAGGLLPSELGWSGDRVVEGRAGKEALPTLSVCKSLTAEINDLAG